MKCRHCHTQLTTPFLDLGSAPPSNAYVSREALDHPEPHFPLRIHVCPRCWLVQTEDYTQANELFTPDYAYFSSTSTSWLAHAQKYVETIIPRLGLNEKSLVIEIASNDGYLLKNFVEKKIPCLGIEPTAQTAAAARAKGVPTQEAFFTTDLASTLKADLLIGNNVFAHVPDINDFTNGLRCALKKEGTITLEFPHVLHLLQEVQFDTIYHEHYSYLSLFSTCQIFKAAHLRIFDVEKLPTHGGSLRVYGCHVDDPRASHKRVQALLDEETAAGLQNPALYATFQTKADAIKNAFLDFLTAQKRSHHTLAAYGAAAKGNTLLNFAQVTPELLPFVCDAAPSKQGKFLPGSHIPIYPPTYLRAHRPDTLLILPWNLQKEVAEQLHDLRTLGTRFFVALPRLLQI